MKSRLDLELVSRQLAPTRSQAQLLIMLGQVFVNEQKAVNAAQPIKPTDQIVIQKPLRYVSRGGLKLEHALQDFKIKPDKYTCLDIGASTGGFTDCLLQNGSAKVYALDVGTHQLADKLLKDPRVISMEKTNFRLFTKLPEPIDLVVIDVSFISATKILQHLIKIFSKTKTKNSKLKIILLLKPQFESTPKQNRKGVIKNPKIHQQIIQDFQNFCHSQKINILNQTTSPIKGPKGNTEFLFHLEI